MGNVCQIIQFPKTERAERFYRKFFVNWSDGITFEGATLDECFRKQKDVFEPEISMLEYLERFRQRLEVVTGKYYTFRNFEQLANVLCENGFLEVVKKVNDRKFDTKPT